MWFGVRWHDVVRHMSSSQEQSADVDDYQIDHARGQGDYYLVATEYLVEEVAVDGGTRQVGPYVVGVAFEPATGRWECDASGLAWSECGDDRVAVAVALADVEDGRFVPESDVTLHVDHDRYVLEFVWHPAVNHYGTTVPADAIEGADLAVTVDAPSFPRRDAVAGERFLEPVEVPLEAPNGL